MLAGNGNSAFIISKCALECQPYNTTDINVTWETCTLRSWLNGTFYNTAFSTAEKAKILTTTVVNSDNPTYGTDGGSNTQDKVFLLSINEANMYFANDTARMCVPTAYALAQGAFVTRYYAIGDTATCLWGLRSPGDEGSWAADVDVAGMVDDYGGAVSSARIAVRPAMWIDLAS